MVEQKVLRERGWQRGRLGDGGGDERACVAKIRRVQNTARVWRFFYGPAMLPVSRWRRRPPPLRHPDARQAEGHATERILGGGEHPDGPADGRWPAVAARPPTDRRGKRVNRGGCPCAGWARPPARTLIYWRCISTTTATNGYWPEAFWGG